MSAGRPRIAIVTPWYPNVDEPVVGLFVAKQAAALRTCADVTVIHTQLACEKPRWILRRRLLGKKPALAPAAPPPDMMLYFPFRWAARLLGAKLALRWLARRIRRALSRTGRVDGVLSWISWPAGCASSHAARALGVRCAVMECTSAFESFLDLPGVRPELEALYRGGDALLSVSPLMTRRMEQALGFSFPVTEIGCVAGDEYFRLPLERAAAEKTRVLCVGAICHDKGQHLLIESAAKLNARGREDFEITCAGFGPDLELLRRRAAEQGVAHLVKFPGGVTEEEKLRLFSAAHFFVTPTLHDTFGAVVAEAMAAGLPVVSSPCGAAEWMVDETTGLLCATGDGDSLAAALEEMFGRCPHYDRAAIRQRVQHLFGEAGYAQRVLAALQPAA